METKSKSLSYFFLVILLAIIFVVGWLWGKLNPGILKNLPLTGKEVITPTIKAPGKVTEDITINEINQVIESPWQQPSVEQLNSKKDVISKEELDNKYRELRLSLLNGNLDKTLSIISSAKIWYSKRPKTYVGVVNGLNVYKESPYSPDQQHFSELLYNTPPTDEISVETVSYLDKLETVTNASFYLYNENTQKADLIKNVGWLGAAELEYQITNSEKITGSGLVTFVLDNGEWKYEGEHWFTTVKDSTKQYLLGETYNNQNLLVSYQPDIVNYELKVNDYFELSNIKGLFYIYKTDTGEYWSTPFLDYDTYRKQLTKPGNYYFRFVDANQDEDVYGTIKVS